MKFSYLAIDKTGKRTYGEIDAEGQKAASENLRAQSLMPLKIESGVIKKSAINTKNLFGKVPVLEKVTFIKNLAVMVKAGFPISRALSSLTAQTRNPTFGKALADVTAQVESGQTLADSMIKYPKIFSTVMVSVIKVGEVSGNLEESLFNLALQLEKDHNIVRKTKGALIYPGIVLTAMLLLGIIMFTFVLPKLTALFADFDVKLPLMTRMIIGVVDFMKSYGIFILIVLIAAIAGFMFALRKAGFRNFLDKHVLQIPNFGRLIKYTNLARFARTLASLLHSGMPILESVKVTGEALNNNEYRVALVSVENMVRGGAPMSAALKNYKNLFPPMLVNMVEVGEESGAVDTILLEVASFYEEEVDQAVSNLSSILEPVLMIVVGVGVGILAMGLVMPIYSITQSI